MGNNRPIGLEWFDYQVTTQMAQAERKEQWITAAEAVRLLKPVFNSEYEARITICRRAYAGLIRARAEHFMVGDDRSDGVRAVPKEFLVGRGAKRPAAKLDNW
jgi:hypothetical protein